MQAELDEIDIDLDQLLDMDGDDTRRRWLKVSAVTYLNVWVLDTKTNCSYLYLYLHLDTHLSN